MSRQKAINQERKLKFEEFEQRLVMSAQAVGSLLPELEIASPAITQQAVTLEDAGTQASDLAAQYGFDGSGQTVAVIDSGIAWDHYAFGNGYGEGHKVVGGWDFAENDANPYDDGPAGYHGTHVAGIIAGNDDLYSGVAPGADLVGLRVFGDDGQGSLEWVEQALQWVHENKDSFEHPITTVNLSLGTEWNAANTPEWAILEDEFAQLEADGLFISVAAGNSFANYGEAGLSYPAVSDHVVPVASHDAEGNISDFSQRDQGVLVAPGESLRSAAPDHLFVGGRTNQFISASGTSQAAPYVAGASAILRQANEFAGVENIDQDLLYQQFIDSADRIYDAVTGGFYHRLNLEAALESVIQDRHAGSVETATDAGTFGGGETIEGTIGKISDVDAFEFTAQQTGRITLSFEVTDELVPLVDVIGHDAQIQNNEVTFDVVAGQKYNFAVATADGNGHYRISVALDDSFAGGELFEGERTDLGTIVSSELLNQTIDGENIYEVTAVRNGLLTIQTGAQLAGGESLTVEVYDSQNNLVGTSVTDRNGETRLDINAKKGESYIVKAIGQADSVDFRFDNLVSLQNGFLSIHGTNNADTFSVSTENRFSINVNGVEYEFDHSSVNVVNLFGHKGDDSIDVTLGDENDTVGIRADGLSVANQNFRLNALQIEDTSITAGEGYDVVSIADSSGHDVLTGEDTADGYSATLTRDDSQSTATGFDLAFIKSTGGDDSAQIVGTAQDDLYISRGTQNILRVNGTNFVFNNFATVEVDGGGGQDSANLNDTAGADRFELSPRSGSISNALVNVSIDDFSRINAISRSGIDSVVLTDSIGSDSFDYRNNRGVLQGDGYLLYASGFDNVEAISVGGDDVALIHDTTGNDTFYSTAGDVRLDSDTASVSTKDFKVVDVVANQGGFDRAIVRGTDGADVVHADTSSVELLNSNGQANSFSGLDNVELDLGSGFDMAFLTGSEDRETLDGSYDEVEFETTLQLLHLTAAERTEFDGNGGGDSVELEDLDVLESIGDKATAYMNDRSISVEDIAVLAARSVDDAIADYSIEAVDYLYQLRGKWAQK